MILPAVTIVGCGALGSHVALLLRNEAQLTLVDGDRVEAKNVLSQNHVKSAVGRNKAQALQGMLAMLHGIKTEIVPRMLTVDNVTALLKDAALVIDCTDNVEPRTLMHREFMMRSVSVLHTALAAGEDGFGHVVWDSPSYRADANTGGAPTCHAGENLPMAALVAAYTAKAAQRQLREGIRIGYAISSTGAIAL